jgi:MFS transporter, UMF1 family
MATTERKRIWGWWSFDWASQPYNTLLLTFIFGPYVASVLADGTAAQSVWGYGIAAAGFVIAIASPLLGAIADRAGGRMRFIWLFSLMYAAGAWGLWWSAPDSFNVWWVMACFAIGLIGMEFATNFTNSMMPDLCSREELGRVSGTGWAIGYAGGVIALIIMLTLFSDDGGKTLIGIDPILGLDAAEREGTRAVGPLSAIWYVVFMIPFFLWVRETPVPGAVPVRQAAREAWPQLRATLRSLPGRTSFTSYLVSSMFYRDALNGMFTFGGIYAVGMLGWQTQDVGVFGILAALTGAVAAWLGGKADSRFGPKVVIVVCVVALSLVALGVIGVTRQSVFGLAVGPESSLPDIAFYVLGALIGAGAGVLQSASRTMMVRQSPPDRMAESFGLFALTGKATSFLAPLSIAVVTDLSDSQRIGVMPLIVMFLIGLVLLWWVKPNGEQAAP